MLCTYMWQRNGCNEGVDADAEARRLAAYPQHYIIFRGDCKIQSDIALLIAFNKVVRFR